ncbi:MAG TPA: DUF2115 domain-containing protein [Methanospirillum sp.]|nr:DUF2115 domain-containing protein [Methanospirillum sp.]
MSDPSDPIAGIRLVAGIMGTIQTKEELRSCIACHVRTYSMYDLQLICGKLDKDIRLLPNPYRSHIKPYLREWIFGRYHQVLSQDNHHRNIPPLTPLTDPDTYLAFCRMLPDGCVVPGDPHDPFPDADAPRYHLFMYLIAAFAMYVLDEPGHPAGMPFPGGKKVRRSGDVFYCPIRDKEEEIFYSICNFCPALQDLE